MGTCQDRGLGVGGGVGEYCAGFAHSVAGGANHPGRVPRLCQPPPRASSTPNPPLPPPPPPRLVYTKHPLPPADPVELWSLMGGTPHSGDSWTSARSPPLPPCCTVPPCTASCCRSGASPHIAHRRFPRPRGTPAQYCHSILESDLQKHQQRCCLHGVEASVHVVPHEQIIRVRYISSCTDKRFVVRKENTLPLRFLSPSFRLTLGTGRAAHRTALHCDFFPANAFGGSSTRSPKKNNNNEGGILIAKMDLGKRRCTQCDLKARQMQIYRHASSATALRSAARLRAKRLRVKKLELHTRICVSTTAPSGCRRQNVCMVVLHARERPTRLRNALRGWGALTSTQIKMVTQERGGLVLRVKSSGKWDKKRGQCTPIRKSSMRSWNWP